MNLRQKKGCVDKNTGGDMDKYLLEKIDYNSCVALIPARSGSKGVFKKNIRSLKGYPLIAYSIIASKLSTMIDRVIVSTDSKEIALIAKEYGAEVPFLRPVHLADDQSGDIDFVEHAIEWFGANEPKIPGYIVHIRPTTPLRDVNIIDDAIQSIQKNPEATSLRSGHLASESPFKWFQINKDGYFESICKGLSNDGANNGRQKFPDVYIPDGYVDVIKTDFVIKNRLLHGNNMIGYKSPVCVEVDTEDDFKMLEYQIDTLGSYIYDCLIVGKKPF